MKKLLALTLALVMMALLISCGKPKEADGDDVSDITTSDISTEPTTNSFSTTETTTSTTGASSTAAPVATTNPIINGKYREITVKGEKAFEIFEDPKKTENSSPDDFIIDKKGVLLAYIGNAVNVRFPDKLKRIEKRIVEVKKDVWEDEYDLRKVFYNGKEITQFKDVKTLYIPASMTGSKDGSDKAGWFVLRGKRLLNQVEKITFGKGCKVIYNRCLIGAKGVKEIILNEGLEEIDVCAFNGTGITTIKLPKSLKIIGSFAFNETPLTEIKLPKGLKSIGNNAFTDTLLTEITIPGGVEFDNNDPHIGSPDPIFPHCLEKVILEEGLKEIPDICFISTAIKEITIPKSVKKIGDDAFFNCTNLKKVIFEGDLPKPRDTSHETLRGFCTVDANDKAIPLPNLTIYYREGAKGFRGDEITFKEYDKVDITYPLVMLPKK